MNKYIEEMIKQGILVGGKIIKQSDFVVFKRLPLEELLELDESKIAYATQSMGRAIFTIDSSNKITNIKGVDSQLDNTELAPAYLVQAESVYISNPNKSYSESTYPINLVKFPGKQIDIRMRGAAPLEDLEIEADINKRMQDLGIKLPKIDFVREFTTEFCKKIGLPIKIPGNYSELESDYEKQNNERKQYLKEQYGEKYQEEVIEGMRAETINEFFSRLGIYNLPEFIEFAKKSQMSIEDFVQAVDKSYSLGQRYGQAKRIVESPFRIADLEYYVKIGDIAAINNIISFTRQTTDTEERVEISYAKQMGENLAILMNNGWVCENLAHRQDFTLAGEMCDDAYYELKSHLKDIDEKFGADKGKKGALKNDAMKDYFAQIFHIASTIKVLQDEMRLREIDENEIDLVLENFVDSFTSTLNLEKISEVLGTDINKIKEVFQIMIGKPSDYRKLLATKSRAETPIYDKPIMLSHADNNVFFNETATKIAEKMDIERSFISESKNMNSRFEYIGRRKNLNEQNSYISKQIQKYKKENPDLYTYIANIVNEKNKIGIWDRGIEGESNDLTTMLLYEYASSMEKITEGKVSAKFVVDKLSNEIGRFRFGDYKTGIDDVVEYGNSPVTSNEYKRNCRIATNFGAHAPIYFDGTEEKSGIVLFDDTQKYVDENGNIITLSGIDLSNLSDIRGTVFHEWTHCMEKVLVEAGKLSKRDIVFDNNGSKFINSMASADWQLEEYEEFIDSVDRLISENEKIYFNGISTIEINRARNNEKRIMHNQIDEGAVEFISRLVIAEVGDIVIDPSRYAEQVGLIKNVFESRGLVDSVATYVTQPNKLVQELESEILPNGSDLLHYMDDYVTLLSRLESGLKERLKRLGKSSDNLKDTKNLIVTFWKEYPNPTDDESAQKVEEIVSKLGLDSSDKVVNLIRKGVKFPKIKKELESLISERFKNKSETSKRLSLFNENNYEILE